MPRSVKGFVEKISQASQHHHERHRPTGFGFALADSIRYLNGAQWDSVVSDSSFFLSRPYLQVLEDHSCPSVCQRYSLIYRGQRPVAAVLMQLADLSAAHVVKSSTAVQTRSATRLKKLTGTLSPKAHRLRDEALGRLKTRILVCGNLLTWGMHGVAFAAEEDPSQLWPAVTEALFRVRRAERLSGQTDFVMVKDLSHPECASAAALDRFSYRAMDTEPNMLLELPPEWKSYDDYLGSLSASYRKVARRIHKDIEGAGCRVRTLDCLDDHADAIHTLYLQVHRNARVRLVTIPAGYLPALAAIAPERFRCTVVEREGRFLGFVTTLKDRDAAVGYLIGFDRESSASLPIYLRLLHAVIADALELGCQRISFGRTALEPKARLGAKPHPFRIWVRHRQPVLNLLVGNLLRSVSHEEPPERHPFK